MSAADVPDFLARIADDRRRRIHARMGETPAHVLRARLAPPGPGGVLERALRRPGAAAPLAVIAEVKRASPSRGALDPGVDPVERAVLYERGGARAISLVTEPDHFQGELEWVDRVRPHVKLPILMKDFVVDSWQLIDAAARGADAVLLIAAMHGEAALTRYINEARVLGLDVLAEVHTRAELQMAVRAGATLIGINNRDLHTFEVRIETALELLADVPPLVTAVAESGVARAEDLARLRATRCDAVLIGEAFMLSGDPAATLAGLLAAARG